MASGVLTRGNPLTRGLNDRMIVFAVEYALSMNGCQAVVKAGYSDKNPGSQATKLLKNPKVAALIKALRVNDLGVKGLQAEDIKRKVAASIHRDYTQLVDEDGKVFSDIRDIPKEAFAYIDGFDVTQWRTVFADDKKEVFRQEIKIKLSPNTGDRALAAKIAGVLAPTKFEGKVAHIDFTKLYEDGPPEDVIEAEIEKVVEDET